MENADDGSTGVSQEIVDTIMIGHNPSFYTLCRDLRENPSSLVRTNVCLPDENDGNDTLLEQFVSSMSHNITIQSLTLIIPEDVQLGSDNARRLGEMMARPNSTVKNLVVSNFSAHICSLALQSFWQGVALSSSLSVIAVHGLNVSQCGIVEAQQMATLQGYILDKCTFDTDGTQALVGMMEQKDSPVVMVRIDRCFMGTQEKKLLAQSLAGKSILPAFSFDDTDLDDPCTDAFAIAIAKNSTLRHVEFHSCSDRTLRVLTNAVAENLHITGGKITGHPDNKGKKASIALVTQCQLQINHYTALNRAGRKFLRDDAPRPNGETIETFWFHMLNAHREDCSMTFSLLRDYSTVFLRCLGLWESQHDTTRQPQSAGAKRALSDTDDADEEMILAEESSIKRTKCNA